MRFAKPQNLIFPNFKIIKPITGKKFNSYLNGILFDNQKIKYNNLNRITEKKIEWY